MSDINPQFLRALMDTIPDRIYFKDREGRFLSVNRAFLDFLKLEREEEIVGKTDFDIFQLEHAQEARADEVAVLASGVPVTGKMEKEVRPDGGVTWVSTTKVSLRDAGGRVIGICGISRDVTEEHRQAEMLQEVAAALQQQQSQIEGELELAQQIQGALLPLRYPSFPPAAPEDQSALRFSHRYLPKGRVGGDFFTIFPVSPTRAGVLICDVMGHGVHAALITAVQRVLVEDLQPLSDRPGVFLEELNKRLTPIFHRLKTTLFVTALYAVIDAVDGSIRFASAAHPAPLLLRREGGVRVVGAGTRARAALPLGVLEDTAYPEREDRMEAGDRLLLFTDGLRDLGENVSPECDDEQFLALVGACAVAVPFGEGEFLDAVLAAVQRDAGVDTFLDDVCLVEVVLRRSLA